jgi:hypothetical protein
VFAIGFTMFSLSELKAATENFSDKNKIGAGGFGYVYKVLYPLLLGLSIL